MSGRRSRAHRAFQKVGKLRLGRTVFDGTHEHKTTLDMGQLVPIFHHEMNPGDIFHMSNEIVLRFNPLVAPLLHEVNVYTHTFFVTYRTMLDRFVGLGTWEEFVRRGDDGDTDIPLPQREDYASLATPGTLLDKFGLPLGIDPVGAYPLMWPWFAYNMIWNEYYRDQDLQDEVPLDQNEVLRRCWEKDYFTIARPDQQRGTSAAIPLSGLGSAVFKEVKPYPGVAVATFGGGRMDIIDGNTYVGNGANENARTNVNMYFNDNTIDFEDVATFNTKDLRVVVQLQKWQERNMRAGTRYIEILQSHFDTYPTDERLQRPEYIGGTKSPVIVSEVLQTSSTDQTSPQGNLAGHAITADRTMIGRYKAKEHGYIMTLLSVMPRTNYQQGIPRHLQRRTVWDFYWPEFAHLSEQAVLMSEIYATSNPTDNMQIFGYQGQYDELRYIPSYSTGGMRDTFDYWHLSRKFADKPLLNSSFVECNPSKRIFAVQNEDGLILNYATVLRMIRPMPVIADPGLVDHF